MNFKIRKRFRHEFEKRIKSEAIYLCAAAISVTTTAGFGIVLAWTSPALPHLTGPKSNLPVSEIQGALIASVLGYGIIFGFIVNPIIVNRFGAKRTLLVLAAPQILSWIIIYFGKDWLLLCFARIVSGFAYGAGLCTTAIYLSEIGDDNNRGAFLTLINLSSNFGIFFMMALGASLSYDAMNLVLLIIPLVFVVSFFPMPDKREIQEDDVSSDSLNHSSVFPEVADVANQHPNNSNGSNQQSGVFEEEANSFINHQNDCTDNGNNTSEEINRKKFFIPPSGIETSKIIKNRKGGKREETIESKVNGYSKTETIQEEVSKLLKKDSRCLSKTESSRNVWWKLFMLKNNRNALMIILIVGIIDIFSGHLIILAYTQQIFEDSGASFGAEYEALILGVMKIGGALMATVVVDKFGRRNLYLSTGILAGLSEGLVALFFFLKLYLKMEVSSFTWLPLLGLAIYQFVGSLGPFCLYSVYQGELFSDDVVSLGISFTNIVYELLATITKLYFQRVVDVIGIHYVFFGFAITFVSGACIIYWITPETRGKSKEEIRKLLS